MNRRSILNMVVPVKHPTTVLVQEKSASESLEEAIEAIAQKLSALPPDKLLAGLSVLVRDLDTIKGELQPREAAFFADTFEPIIAEERRDHRGNTIFIADKSNLPSGMASDYAKGKRGRNGLTSQLQLNGIEEVLSSDAIVNERTTATGERILGKFMRKCKDVICGKGGPYETFVKKSAGQKALEGQIGAAILGMGIAASSPLVPLGACCAVLLVKTGLKTLCDP